MGVIACGIHVSEHSYNAVLKSSEAAELANQFRTDINKIYNVCFRFLVAFN